MRLPIIMKSTIFILFFSFLTNISFAQNPSAVMDIESTTQGVLVPRMTTAQRTLINAPATGLLVFDTNTVGFWFYDGTDWVNLSQGADADSDPNNELQTLSITDYELTISNGNTISLPGNEQIDGDENTTVFNINDTDPLDAVSTITLAEPGVITAETFIEVCVDIDYDWQPEVEIRLVASDGVGTIVLANGVGTGGFGSFTNTCFRSDAVTPIGSGSTPFTGSFIPQEALSLLVGQNIAGTWTLIVTDTNSGNGDTGMLNSWSINFSSPNNTDELSDADFDTSIKVEANPDEDKIRFNIDGEEVMVFEKNADGQLMMNGGNDERTTFLGKNAGQANTQFGTDGVDNTFLGYEAGAANSNGSKNTFVGSGAGAKNVQGAANVFFGDYAGNNNNGDNNVFIGSDAGLANLTGNDNIFIGNDAGLNETGSNKLYISNDLSNANNALIYGEFDNSLLKLNGDVEIKNELSLSIEGMKFNNAEIINKGISARYYICYDGVFPSDFGNNPDAVIGELKLTTFINPISLGGWLPCEGQILQIVDYTALFSIIGFQFGGDGLTTFALPDLRNAVPVFD